MKIDRMLRRFFPFALAFVLWAKIPLAAAEVVVSVVSRHPVEHALSESELTSSFAVYERMRAPAGYQLEAIVLESTARWAGNEPMARVEIEIANASGARIAFLGILSPTGAYFRTARLGTTMIRRLGKEPSTTVRFQVLCLVKDGEGLSVSVGQNSLPLPVPVGEPAPRASFALQATIRSNEVVEALVFERENNDSKPDQLGFRYRLPGGALRVVHFDYRIQSDLVLRGGPTPFRAMYFGLKTREGEIIRPIARLSHEGGSTVRLSASSGIVWRHDPVDDSCHGDLHLVFADAPGLEDAEVVFNFAPSGE